MAANVIPSTLPSDLPHTPFSQVSAQPGDKPRLGVSLDWRGCLRLAISWSVLPSRGQFALSKNKMMSVRNDEVQGWRESTDGAPGLARHRSPVQHQGVPNLSCARSLRAGRFGPLLRAVDQDALPPCPRDRRALRSREYGSHDRADVEVRNLRPPASGQRGMKGLAPGG